MTGKRTGWVIAAASLILLGVTQVASATTSSGPSKLPRIVSPERAHQLGLLGTTSVDQLADGGSLTTIPLESGLILRYAIPPAGFNPLTANGSQLLEYGFPARPSDVQSLALWSQAMSAPLKNEAPAFNLVLTPLSTLAIPTTPSRAQNTYNGNWGGYTAKGSSSTYSGSQGYFNVPTVTNTSSCSTPYFSIWSGIGGGVGSSSLIQSGLIYNLAGVSYPNSADWSSFIEFLYGSVNHGPTDLIALAGKSWTVHTADTIFTQTTYSSASRGTATFYLEDASTGQYASYSIINMNVYYDGSTAETIQESHNGYPFKDSGVSWLYVSQQLASNGSWQPLLSASATDKYIGYYSSPSAMSSSDNTSNSMSSTASC